MEYRVLGRSGIRVSRFGLGSMMFGAGGNPDPDECATMVHSAIDAGINLVDTADVYSRGESEEFLGRALRGRRDEVVLATKGSSPMGPGVNERGASRLWITRAVEDSLRRLQTDHLDLYQIHRPDPDTDIEQTLSALTDLVCQGKIRSLGTSMLPAWQAVDAQAVSDRRGLERFVSEQPPYSIFARGAEVDVFPMAQQFSIGVIVWSPLSGGWLTGKYRRGQSPSAGSRATRARAWNAVSPQIAQRFDFSRPGNQRKLDCVEALSAIAEQAGLTLAHLAMAFAVEHPAVTSAIVGPRTPEQLADLLTGTDVTLDTDTLDAIDEVVAPGSILEEADGGWLPPWLARNTRRRTPDRLEATPVP
jgi:aryl-alcohol dehydrogenase-like predicted oxidoreductase